MKSKYGELKLKKPNVPPLPEVVDRKLRERRSYFDSADYFRAAQGVKDVPLHLDAPSCIYEFTRDKDGHLIHTPIPVPFSPVALSQAVAKSNLNLHGTLEYPLGSQPYPIAMTFNDDKLSVVPHPTHAQSLPQENLAVIARKADEELQRRYGGPKTSPNSQKVLSLKLRGETPHKKKETMFDSADWALTLYNLPPTNNTDDDL